MARRRASTLLLGAAILPAVLPALLARPVPARAQAPATHVAALSKTEPVTFTADSVSYDRDHGIVTATGHVEAWQNDHQLRADTVTFDRNTGVMAARGHVQMIDPSGEILFSDYAELTSGMKDGVLRGMRALLASNGRLVANGARRVNGQINELSKVIYSTCNLCVKHPTDAPIWQIKAHSAVQDLVNKRIEYHNAYLDVFGLPIFYLPYFSNADPSVKRASGLLIPSIGNSTHLGAFAEVPYYWAIDPSSDAVIIPMLATRTGPQVNTVYRKSFNNGTLRVNASVAHDEGTFAGHLYTAATFSYNDTWRYGFDINVATSEDYLRNFNIAAYAQNVLNSQIFIEGFGEGAYAKLSALSYQGLNSTVSSSDLPYVLPRYQYDYFGLKDRWGGRLSVDTDDFNVVRKIGTNDERANLNLQWERPGIGAWGDVWSITGRVESLYYNGYDVNQQPNFASVGNARSFRAQPTLAFKIAEPFMRADKSGGSLIVEPIAQFILSPNAGSSSYSKLPNEDSLAPEFTDTELFSLNRFNGIDRQEGGIRVNVGLHATWNTARIGSFDGIVGQAYHLHNDDAVPAYVGLNKHFSDVVGRITYTPDKYLDLTARTRVDNQDLRVHFAEAQATFGPSWLRLGGGYIYSANTPYWLDAQPPAGNPNLPRNELQLSASTGFGRYRFAVSGTRDLQSHQMVAAGADATYEDECLIFNLKFTRRYTSIDNDSGDTTVLVQITLKTLGSFGFHAL